MADEGIVVPISLKLKDAAQFESAITQLFTRLGDLTKTAATGSGGLVSSARGSGQDPLSVQLAGLVKAVTQLEGALRSEGVSISKGAQEKLTQLREAPATVLEATREGRSPSQAGRLQRASESLLAADAEYTAALKAASRTVRETTVQQGRVGAESALFAGEVGKGAKATNVLPGAHFQTAAENARLQEQAFRDAEALARQRADYTPEAKLSDADVAPRKLVHDARLDARRIEQETAKAQLKALEDAQLLPLPLRPKGATGGEYDYVTNLDPALRKSKYVSATKGELPDKIQDWLNDGVGQAGGFSAGQGGGDLEAFARHVNDLRLLASPRGAPSQTSIADVLKGYGLGAPFVGEVTPIVAGTTSKNEKEQGDKVRGLQQQLRQSALAQQARELTQFGTGGLEEQGPDPSIKATRENVLKRRVAQEQRGLQAVTADAATLEALAAQDREDAEDAQVAGRKRAREAAGQVETLGQARERGFSEEEKEKEREKLRKEYLGSYVPPGGGGRGPGGPNEPPYTNPEGGGDEEHGYHLALAKVREGLDLRYESVLESLIKEQVLSQEYGHLISATGELAAFRRSNAARENAVTEEALAGDKLYIKATADAAFAKRVSSAQIKAQELASVKASPLLTGLEGQNAAGSRLEAARISIKEQQILGEADNLKLLAEESAAKKINAAAEKRLVEQTLATGAEAERYQAATAEAANLQRLTAAQIKARTQQGVGVGGKAGLAYIEQIEAANNVEARLAKARVSIAENTLLAQQENLVALAEERASNRANAALTRRQTRVIEEGIFNQGSERGSFVQRIQAAAKQKEDGDFVNPLEQQTGAQLLKSKFLTTATFAVSGVATYAAFSGFQTLLKDSAELERKLSLIKAEFAALGDGSAFASFKTGILGISRDTGVAAGEVADIAIRFKGAFSGLSDTGVLTQVRAAVELSKVTGISLQDITNNLTAAAVVYGTSITHVGDAALTLQDRTGVSAKEIIQASSDMAVAAENAGATFEQVVALAAVGAKYTGQSGSLVAEGLNRIVPAINSKAGGVVQLIEQAAPEQTKSVVSALAQGEQFKVFDIIGKNYDKLTKSQQAYLISLLGSRRDAKTAIDIFSHYNEVLDDQGAALNSNGRLAESWSQLQGTLSQQISKVTAALKSMAATILSLGISDFLQILAKVLGTTVNVIGEFFSILAKGNDILFGIPGKIAAITVAVIALGKAMSLVRAAGYLGAVGQVASKIPGGGLVQSVTRTAGADTGIVAGGEKAAAAMAAAIVEAGETAAAAMGIAITEAGGVSGAEGAAARFVVPSLGARGTVDLAAKKAAATTTLEEAAGVNLGGLAYDAKPAATGIKAFFGTISGAMSEGVGVVSATTTAISAALDGFVAAVAGFATPLLAAVVAVEGILFVINVIKAATEAGKAQRLYDDYLQSTGVGPTPTPEDRRKKAPKSEDQKAADEYNQKSQPQGFESADFGLNPFHIFGHAAANVGKFIANKPDAQTESDQQNRARLAQPFAQALKGLSKKELEDALGSQDGGDGTATGSNALKHPLTSKDIADIAAGKAGGLKGDKFQALLKIVTDYSKTNKEIGPAVAKLLGITNKKAKDIADAAQALVDLPTLQIQKELGSIGTREFLSKVGAQRDSTKAVLAQAIKDHAPQDQIKSYKTELDAENTAFNGELDKHLQDLAQAGLVAGTIHGNSASVQAKIQAASALSAIAFKDALDSAQLPSLIQTYITSQQTVLQSAIDAAPTGAAAAQITAKGIKVSPTAQQGIAKGIIQQSSALEDLNRLSNGLGYGGDINKLLDKIVTTKGGVRAGIQRIIKQLEGQISRLKAAGGHDSHVRADENHIASLQALLDSGSLDGLDTLFTQAPPPPSRQERRDAKNAISQALVAGNPVASAIEGQNEAADLYNDLVTQYNLDLELSQYRGPNQRRRAQAKAAAGRLAADRVAKDRAQAGKIGADNARQDADAAAAEAAISNAGFSQDPVAAAATAQRLAAQQVTDALAKNKGDYNSAGVQQALLSQKQADASYQDAVNAIPQAQAAVLSAQADGDPVKVAQAAIIAAQAQYAAAHGTAAQLQALAQEISAQHQLRDALNAVADAQQNIVIATLQAAGKTVEAAKAQLSEDKNAYNRYLKQHPGATKENDANAAGLYQKTITDAANVRDAALENAVGDINFGLATHKIFNSQAIARLKVLDQNQKLTKAEHQQLEEQIYNLQHQSQQDLQFNLPTDIKLPTLYEARRFNEGGAGGQSYQDNRNINIQITANTKATPQEIAAHVATAIKAPPRNGPGRKTY